MVPENMLAYAVKQKEIDYESADLVIMQAQIFNRNSEGKVMVEKIASASRPGGARYHIPGVAMKFGEHPEEAGHRVLTEELEVADRNIKLIEVQSHIAEKNMWYLLFLFESELLTEEEMAHPCEGIEELVYIDPEAADENNSTTGLRDIREAMKNPGKNFT